MDKAQHDWRIAIFPKTKGSGTPYQRDLELSRWLQQFGWPLHLLVGCRSLTITGEYLSCEIGEEMIW
jgi:hypothetical protein